VFIFTLLSSVYIGEVEAMVEHHAATHAHHAPEHAHPATRGHAHPERAAGEVVAGH
jgi:hypothetical protein